MAAVFFINMTSNKFLILTCHRAFPMPEYLQAIQTAGIHSQFRKVKRIEIPVIPVRDEKKVHRK